VLVEEQNTLGSQRAQKGDRSRQRTGEVCQEWPQTHDSPQLLAMRGDLLCPKASLSVSATFLLCSAGCLNLIHPGASSGCLDASLPRSFLMHSGSHVQLTETPSPRALCWWCTLSGMAGSDPSLPRRPDTTPCWNPLCFAPQPGPTGRHAQAAPLAQQGEPIPTCSLLNTLAQPYPHLTGPTWAALVHSWSPSGTGAMAPALQHIGPSPGPFCSHCGKNGGRKNKKLGWQTEMET